MFAVEVGTYDIEIIYGINYQTPIKGRPLNCFAYHCIMMVDRHQILGRKFNQHNKQYILSNFIIKKKVSDLRKKILVSLKKKKLK